MDMTNTYVMATMPKVDELVVYASFAIIAIVSVLLYIMAVSNWLISLLVAKRRGAIALRDRGLKKFTYPEGRGVVYEPAGFDNKFLKKYILFTHGEYRYIKCLFADLVRSAYCEVFVFDNQNQLIKTVDLFLKPDKDRNTEAILLPDATSHVSVLVLKVNGRDVKLSARDKQSYTQHIWQRRGLFVLLTVAVTVLEGFILMSLVRYFLDLFMVENYSMTFANYVGRAGRWCDILISFVAGLFVAGVGILSHLKKDRI
jgi:hypothetical protein